MDFVGRDESLCILYYGGFCTFMSGLVETLKSFRNVLEEWDWFLMSVHRTSLSLIMHGCIDRTSMSSA